MEDAKAQVLVFRNPSEKLCEYKEKLSAMERRRQVEIKRARILSLVIASYPFMDRTLLAVPGLMREKEYRLPEVSEELIAKAEQKRLRKQRRNLVRVV